MTESLIVVTCAGAAAVSWWMAPRAWWAMFCRSNRWAPFDAVSMTVTPVNGGVDVSRVIAVAVPGAAGTPLLDAIDLVRGDGYRPFGTDADAAALERRAQQIIDQTWSETVWLTGCIGQARFDALCASLEYERLQTVSDMELVVVRELLSETPRTAR